MPENDPKNLLREHSIIKLVVVSRFGKRQFNPIFLKTTSDILLDKTLGLSDKNVHKWQIKLAVSEIRRL